MNHLATTALTPPAFTPNQGQIEAAEAFFQFLFSPDKEFSVSGPGGVGKTRWMSMIIDEIMPRYLETCDLMGIPPEYGDVVMTATTNKAAEVLGTAAGRPTSTIHSFLNLKVQEDYSSGRSTLTKTRGWVVHHNKILFIDEASMIDTPLLDHIHQGTHNSKICYVGDHCQLAPVMEPISPIYRKGLPFYELTEQMRTNVPELQALNQQLRNTVETGQFAPIQIVPGIVDWFDDETISQMVAQTFAQQTKEHRILAYTNRQVLEYNDFLRGERGLPQEFQVGELLVNNSAIQMKSRMLSVEAEVEIIRQNRLTEIIDIAGGEVKLEVRRTDLKDSLGTIMIDVPIPVDRVHFKNTVDYYAREAKGRRRPWHIYYDLKNTYPDLRQRDAATVHKAQGSTHESVFIDLTDISDVRQPDQAARMLYVAASRARKRVILRGNLAPKYGGLRF